MPELGDGISVSVEHPTITPAVERPTTSVSVAVVPVRGLPGGIASADLDEVLAALEPPVALDVLYQNSLI